MPLGEGVAGARLIDELQRDGLAGDEMDRVRREAEAPDADLYTGRRRLRRGGSKRKRRNCGKCEKTNTGH